MRRALVLTLLVGACAPSVQVRHMAPPERLGADASARLSRVFVLVRGPKPVDGDSSKGAKAVDFLKSFVEDDGSARTRALEPAERNALGEAVARKFAAAGSAAAWQVSYADGETPEVEGFRATAVLLLEPTVLAARQESFQAKAGKDKTVTKYRVVSDFAIRWRLLSRPDGNVLAQGRIPADGAGVSQESAGAVSKLEPALETLLKARQAALVSTLNREVLPHPVHRIRTLARGKGTNKKALEKVKKNDWDGAAAMWRASVESDSQDRTAHRHLAIYYERQKKWDEARREYELAGSLSEVAQLDAMARAVRPEASSPTLSFLQERVAVMPFANESVDVDAPVRVRLKALETLKAGGWNVQPAAETEAGLRTIGITDGGQLGAGDPPALAKATGAERLLFGTVEEFRTVNVGVYARRQVRLRLRLTDAAGKELWTGRAEVLAQDAAKPKDAVKSFLTGLATSQIQKVMNTYLEEEIALAVAKVLDPLPRVALAAQGDGHDKPR